MAGFANYEARTFYPDFKESDYYLNSLMQLLQSSKQFDFGGWETENQITCRFSARSDYFWELRITDNGDIVETVFRVGYAEYDENWEVIGESFFPHSYTATFPKTAYNVFYHTEETLFHLNGITVLFDYRDEQMFLIDVVDNMIQLTDIQTNEVLEYGSYDSAVYDLETNNLHYSYVRYSIRDVYYTTQNLYQLHTPFTDMYGQPFVVIAKNKDLTCFISLKIKEGDDLPPPN